MNVRQLRVEAPGKLNLSLDVTGRRPDGYHNMKMVMCSVSLGDTLHIRLTDEPRVRARCGLPYVPGDMRNIACRAARLFLDTVGRPDQGAEITIQKRIPVGAGMAGGSADAAAVLRGLNQLTEAGLNGDQLRALGLQLGSDVPFCVAGGTALAEGRGEILTPQPDLPGCTIVICKPPFPISTPELFARLDWRKIRHRPDTDGLLAALAEGDLPRLARRMYNIFEDVLPPQCAAVGEIRQTLLSMGALGAVMTGTGSAVFGLFDDRSAAEAALQVLQTDRRWCWLAEPVGPAL